MAARPGQAGTVTPATLSPDSHQLGHGSLDSQHFGMAGLPSCAVVLGTYAAIATVIALVTSLLYVSDCTSSPMVETGDTGEGSQTVVLKKTHIDFLNVIRVQKH